MSFDLTRYESKALDQLRAVALIWLNRRAHVLSELSCDEGEWPELFSIGRALACMESLESLTLLLAEAAQSIVNENEVSVLTCAVLDEMAAKYGYAIEVNWMADMDAKQVAR